ncbi:uncharacterized protein LOC129922657 isoform X1 [Biomphalaria glabrata]|uniref:Uncharacterized protein LOC129922657 isoform X1 n=1 Tax=Biomphalaria glabrata TaxID=6526 RepID=A0A9W2YRJ7_BIOGL|nr:uncharacterized protein LOC129922657 isoform X1 [Biomphalaria glabrata]
MITKSPSNLSNGEFNVTLSEEDLQEIVRLTRISNLILKTVPYFLLAFGIPGNVISIAVLSKPSMKDKIFTLFLVSLCLFNLLLLLFSLPRFIAKGFIGREIYFNSPKLCAFVKYATHTLIAISHWHLVVMCTWRLLYYKDKTRIIVQYLHPMYTILSMVVIWSIVYIPLVYFWIVFSNEKGEETECYLPHSSPIVVAVLVIQVFIPSLLLIVVNLIIYFVHSKEIKSGLANKETASKVSQSMLVIVLASCLQFIITVFPVVVIVICNSVMFQLNTRLGAVKYELAYTVAYMLLYTNAATNFIIYCAFGNTFRRELFKMLMPKCVPKQLGPSQSGCSGVSDVSKAEKSVKYLFSYTHSPGPKHSFTVTSEVDPTDFNDLESGS